MSNHWSWMKASYIVILYSGTEGLGDVTWGHHMEYTFVNIPTVNTCLMNL